jgi:hypothetical protein
MLEGLLFSLKPWWVAGYQRLTQKLGIPQSLGPCAGCTGCTDVRPVRLLDKDIRGSRPRTKNVHLRVCTGSSSNATNLLLCGKGNNKAAGVCVLASLLVSIRVVAMRRWGECESISDHACVIGTTWWHVRTLASGTKNELGTRPVPYIWSTELIIMFHHTCVV